MATGPSFVLGALRRPEFDLILRRGQRRSLARGSGDPDDHLRHAITQWSTQEDLNGNSSENDASDTEDVSQGNTSHDDHRSLIAHAASPEKSVWFVGDEDPSCEEAPRLIPRPYWRNKPHIPRTNTIKTPTVTKVNS